MKTTEIALIIRSSNNGSEALHWKRMLTDMYIGYCKKRGYPCRVSLGLSFDTLFIDSNGKDFDKEAGVHRLVRISPIDAEQRRVTVFASVETETCCTNRASRSYFFHPEMRVKDSVSGRTTEDVLGVLSGNLEAFHE